LTPKTVHLSDRKPFGWKIDEKHPILVQLPELFLLQRLSQAAEEGDFPLWIDQLPAQRAPGLWRVIGLEKRYQMDATQADIYLVSRHDRSRVIGRPYIYLAVDTATQLIAGLYVGLECDESAVMLCLANAAQNKVEYCREYGIEIDPAQWPNRGLPHEIITDKGSEFFGSGMQELCQKYGVEVQSLPPFRPDGKGLVEKSFDLIQKRYMFSANTARAVKQLEAPITVILGNPPYSVGQKSGNDNNQNVSYEQLDESLAATYVAKSRATLTRNAYDTYIKAFRWATDRLGDNGVIGFVSNGAYLDSVALDGFCLFEFMQLFNADNWDSEKSYAAMACLA
jgi:hypothetical protein